MTIKSDIEIARAATMKPIAEVAAKVGIPAEALVPYGTTKAKVTFKHIDSLNGAKNGKLILVTAISPTPAGEGKTTTTVGSRRWSQSHRQEGDDVPARALARPVLRC